MTQPMNKVLSLVVMLLVLPLCEAGAADKTRMDDQSQLPKAPARKAEAAYFKPPAAAELPNNAFGEMVRRGEDLFVNTKALAPQYVGNEMNCINCHLDRGRKANSGPLWAAYPMYPA
jgi:thiosulfate dehydrogenase